MVLTSNALFKECIRIRSLSLLSSLRRLRSRADIPPQRRRRPGPDVVLVGAAATEYGVSFPDSTFLSL